MNHEQLPFGEFDCDDLEEVRGFIGTNEKKLRRVGISVDRVLTPCLRAAP